MRYFLDTEHTDDGERFELISIAVVSDDDREYYAAVDGYDDAAVTPWITENVLPKLPPPWDPQWKSREKIRDEIGAFVTGEDIKFWTMCAWPDWSLVVRLFGRFEDVPDSWPMACWDLWQLEAELGVTMSERPPEPDGAHNALVDGRWHRQIHDWLRSAQAASFGPKSLDRANAASARRGTLYQTCVVFVLGYPGMGKRTVGEHLATLLDGVLVDNQLINRPLLALFRWDGKAPIPTEIWDRVVPIREAVLGAIEDLAPPTNSYVFTNVLENDDASQEHFDRVRSLADRGGSLFLSVMLTCDIDVQVSRIANQDRVALMKGSDPEGYRWHRLNATLLEPAAEVVIHIDTTETAPATNAAKIYQSLIERGFRPDRE